jgi:hypothetical protein
MFPSDANVINVKNAPYNAAGNGTTDDTAAIQAAISNAAWGQIVYLPAGTYLVGSTIFWQHTSGQARAWVRLQGQNQSSTVIRLKDNTFTGTSNCAVGTYHGATAGAACRAVLYLQSEYNSAYPSTYGAGEDAYMNSVQDLTINTGNGNPGAIGLDVIISNSGAVRNVAVKSGDGQGRFGIALTRDCCGGPGYLANVTVNGFDYGIAAGYHTPQLGYTLEHVYLSGQNVAGIYNTNFPLWVRDLNSANNVPAVVNAGIGRVTIIQANLTGGASSVSALQDNSNGGVLFARSISTTGYQSAISTNGVVLNGSTVMEFTSKAVQSLFPSVQTSLNLPIKETPTYVNTDFTQWASVKAYGATGNGYTDDTAAIQSALNSGQPVVYFPYATYMVNGTLLIPGSVRLVEGFGSYLVGNVHHSAQPGITFECIATTGGPIILDDFHNDKNTLSSATNASITNNCPGMWFVMRDLFDFNGYQGNANGKVFWEDSAIIGAAQHGGSFWGRQVDIETGGTHLEFDDATGWVLGYKTEGTGGNGMMWAHNGSTVEMLGAFHYPTNVPSGTAYTVQNSNVSLVNIGSYSGFSPAVAETRGPIATMNDNSWDGGIGFALYSGSVFSNSGPGDATAPSTPMNLTATGVSSSQINLSWNSSTDNIGVTGYQIYRNGSMVGSPYTNSYTDNGLTPSTLYSYTVAAVDAGRNISAKSAPASATTLATTTSTGNGGYTIRNNRTGSYLSNLSGVLAMSGTVTVWPITPGSPGSGSLAPGAVTITIGPNAVDGGFGANGATPAVRLFQTTSGNPMQSWRWSGSTFENVGYSGHYLADAGNGTVSEPTSGDTWVVTYVSTN